MAATPRVSDARKTPKPSKTAAELASGQPPGEAEPAHRLRPDQGRAGDAAIVVDAAVADLDDAVARLGQRRIVGDQEKRRAAPPV